MRCAASLYRVSSIRTDFSRAADGRSACRRRERLHDHSATRSHARRRAVARPLPPPAPEPDRRRRRPTTSAALTDSSPTSTRWNPAFTWARTACEEPAARRDAGHRPRHRSSCRRCGLSRTLSAYRPVDRHQRNRAVDLVGEGDGLQRAATSANCPIPASIARRLGACTDSFEHVTCASPAYLEEHGTPATLDDLAGHVSVNCVSDRTGRTRRLRFRNERQGGRAV